MNNTGNNIQRPGKLIRFVIGFTLIFMIYYLIMSAAAPLKRMADLKAQFMTSDPDKEQPDTRLFTDSTYLHLLKERGFLQSGTAMAATDSVCLSLIIPDSMINLEISGVVVHSVKTGNIRAGRMLIKGNDYVISSLLSEPLNIVKDYATIPKEPIMVRIAPKDTSEYQPDILPDTSNTKPVNFILKTDKGINIYIFQEEPAKGNRFKIFFFNLSDRMRYFARSLARIVRFKVPEYHPAIRIRIPRADAKIIYRALPDKGQITVYR